MRTISGSEDRHYATQAEFVANYNSHPGGGTAMPEIAHHIAISRGHQIDDWRWRHKVDRKVYSNREPVDGVSQWNKIKIPTLLMKVECTQCIDPPTMGQAKSRALNIG